MLSVLECYARPSENTFSGYHVIVKWSHFGNWHSTSFTTWEATIKFLAKSDLSLFDHVLIER